MTVERPTPVQHCLDRIQAGDLNALEDLIKACQERVRGIVRAMMARFPRVRRWEGSDDVLNEALLRLHHAISNDVGVKDTAGLLTLSACHINWILLDLARKFAGPGNLASRYATPPAASDAHHPEAQDPSGEDPAKLAVYAELYDRIATLTGEHRLVFDLHWYHGLTHQEIAARLGTSEKTAKRRWVEARLLLGERLKAFLAPES